MREHSNRAGSRRPLDKLLLTLIAVAVLAFLTALAIVATQWAETEPPPAQLELLKVSLQVLGVAVIGGAVAYRFRAHEQERAVAQVEAERAREQRAQNLEALRAMAVEVLGIYNTVKLARRMMRFHASSGERRTDDIFVIPDKPYEELFLQVEKAQLDLERLKKQVPINRHLFSDPQDTELFAGTLSDAEKYIRDVLKEFEQGAHRQMPGGRAVERGSKTMGFFAASDDRKKHGLGKEADAKFFKPMWELQARAIALLAAGG
jgi:hypothetical protein